MQTKVIIKRLSELPKAPTTIGTMAWNLTGDWRYVTPLVADKLAPCSQNCPAGIPIPRHLGAVSHGDFEGALSLLLAHNPLPGLTGRLCYHPCQTQCVRRKIDRMIPIQELERFLGDLATDISIEKGDKTCLRVTFIGSGPLGLSCAFYLGCQGYVVTILDPFQKAGGGLAALPPEKIEPRVLSHEIDRLIRLGDIRYEANVAIDSNDLGQATSKADLVILDPTGLPADFCQPAGTVACDPFDDEAVPGGIVSVQLPKILTPFKAPMIAHYIAAGRLMARKVVDGFNLEGSEKPTPEPPLRAVDIENIRIDRFCAVGPPIEEDAEQDGIRDRKWVTREAGRCLSCGTCNLCLQCVTYCPDASIRQDGEKATVAVDLDHCKGCGICAYECPRGVIAMEDMNL